MPGSTMASSIITWRKLIGFDVRVPVLRPFFGLLQRSQAAAGLGPLSKVYPKSHQPLNTLLSPGVRLSVSWVLFGFHDHAFAYALAVYIVEDLFNIPEVLDLGYGV